MEAPYTRVGPGQSLRLVYQVMGDNGPTPNPRKIRYIPAGSAAGEGLPVPAPPGLRPALPDLSAVMGAVQLANLGFAVVNLAVSTAVLIEVKKQTRMLREMQVGLDQVRVGVEKLLERTERIDLNVAEVQLRATLKHALRSSAKDGEVDLVLLAELVGKALNRYVESLEGAGTPGTSRQVALSSDVREMAEAALHLLWGARLTAIAGHNLTCAGDALRVVRDDQVQRDLQELARTAAVMAVMQMGRDAVYTGVYDQLRGIQTFVGDPGMAWRVLTDRLEQHDAALLRALEGVPEAKALLREFEDSDLLVSARKDGGAAVRTLLMDYLVAWTAHSDAGLIWRLRQEVKLQQDQDYWQTLQGWMAPLGGLSGESLLGVTRSLEMSVA